MGFFFICGPQHSKNAFIGTHSDDDDDGKERKATREGVYFGCIPIFAKKKQEKKRKHKINDEGKNATKSAHFFFVWMRKWWKRFTNHSPFNWISIYCIHMCILLTKKKTNAYYSDTSIWVWYTHNPQLRTLFPVLYFMLRIHTTFKIHIYGVFRMCLSFSIYFFLSYVHNNVRTSIAAVALFRCCKFIFYYYCQDRFVLKRIYYKKVMRK